MNIALLGYGKMGRLIEKIAIKKGHTIVSYSNKKNPIENLNLSNVDVAIDFSTPDSAYNNISFVLNKEIPVVSGTTGWLKELDNINKLAIKKNTAFLYASNFSIGVNLFYELNKKLSQLMQNQHEYTAGIEEIHHNEKLDIPSGTSLILKSQIKNSISIQSRRIEDITGIHTVKYSSNIDDLSITHKAHNRNGFAKGALLASEWIINKKGCFTMSDVLKLN